MRGKGTDLRTDARAFHAARQSLIEKTYLAATVLRRAARRDAPRHAYLEMLKVALDEPTKRGTWELELDLDQFAAAGGDPQPA